MITDRPVASVQEPRGTEQINERCERGPVELRVRTRGPVDCSLREPAHLAAHPLVLGRLSHPLVPVPVRLVTVNGHVRHVIDHDAKPWVTACDLPDHCEIRGLHQEIEREVQFLKDAQVRIGHVGEELSVVDAAHTHAHEERVRRQTAEGVGSRSIPQIHVPDERHDGRLSRSEIENPVVVLEAVAGLYHDSAAYPVRRRDRQEVLRKYGSVEDRVVGRRPVNALRSRRIVEVGVRVDDHAGSYGVVAAMSKRVSELRIGTRRDGRQRPWTDTFGCMNTWIELPADEATRSVVEHYWYLEDSPSDPLVLPPELTNDIVINLIPPTQFTDGTGRSATIDGSYASGVRTRFFSIDQFGEFRIVGVRLRPWALRLRFDLASAMTLNQFVPAPSDIDDAVANLSRRDSITPDVVVPLLDPMFARPAARARDTDRVDAFARLVTEDPLLSVGDVAEELSVSLSTLERLTKRWLGVTPKTASRIVRYNRVWSALHSPDPSSWAEISIDLGYTDQSHFANEFRTFTGVTPAKYLEQRSSVADRYYNG